MAHDQELLKRARAGERAALEELLERHQAQVYRFGMKMCRDPEDAQDVLQDTLLSAARSIRDFRGGASLSTWLYSIARSFCVKKRRHGKHAPKTHPEPLDVAAERAAAPGAQPDEALATKQIEHALEAAIGALEPMYREVLLLRDVEGLTAPEVARVTGASVQAVKSRLHRARLEVRASVAPLLGIPVGLPASQGACPDVLALFSRHLEGQVSAAVCALMEQHLAGCPRCRGVCGSLKQTLLLCRSTSAVGAVPDSVQASVKVALKDFLASAR